MYLAYEFMGMVDPVSDRFIHVYLERQITPPTLALGDVVLLTTQADNFAARYYQGFDPATGEPFFSARADGGGRIFKLTRELAAKGAEGGYAGRVVAAMPD